MACEKQQAAVDELERTLGSLRKALLSALPGQERDVVERIASTREMLDSARSALADCLKQGTEATQTIPIDVSVEVQFSGLFVGNRSERDRFSLSLTLIGSGETRAVTMEPFTIKRAAEVSVAARSGSFTVSTGAMDLSGVVDVRFSGVKQQGQVTLTTESASSPSGKYAASGSRLDPGTLAMVLVGGGAVTVNVWGQELAYEYFVTASCVLADRPAASK